VGSEPHDRRKSFNAALIRPAPPPLLAGQGCAHPRNGLAGSLAHKRLTIRLVERSLRLHVLHRKIARDFSEALIFVLQIPDLSGRRCGTESVFSIAHSKVLLSAARA
jgi:hypothetical protein